MALSKLLILCGGMLAVPVAGQVLAHWLSIDASKSATDALTGLSNRRGFYRAAEEPLAEGVREGAPCFTAVMVDLDDFKRINDTLGHTTGDRILVAVADSLRDACREDTVIARVGGEESWSRRSHRSARHTKPLSEFAWASPPRRGT